MFFYIVFQSNWSFISLICLIKVCIKGQHRLLRWSSNSDWKIVSKVLKKLYLKSCLISYLFWFIFCLLSGMCVCSNWGIDIWFMSQCSKQNRLELNFYYSGAICLILGSCWKSSLHRQEMYIECFYHLQFDWVDQLGFMLSNMLVLCILGAR